MKRILVTNDDGIDAPGLGALVAASRRLGEVTVVVPDRERSWVGKAITRFDPVRMERVERDGFEAYAVSGYPADAVQLGIHALGATPDLVISGINLGYNHGAGFLMSSGTVGAAVEAWISRMPAVALSTGTMADWHAWRAEATGEGSADTWRRLADLAVELVEDVGAAGLSRHCDVISINLPYDAGASTPRRVTTIARVGYDRLFVPDGDGTYVHAYGGGINQIEAVEGSDIDAAHDGAISITPIRMPAAASVPDELRRRIESARD